MRGRGGVAGVGRGTPPTFGRARKHLEGSSLRGPAPPGPESHREHGHEAGAEVEPILWDASGRIRSRRTAACRLCTPLTPTRPLSAPLIVGYVLRWSFFVITLCHPCPLILGLHPAHTRKALLYRCHIVSMKVCFHVGKIID